MGKTTYLIEAIGTSAVKIGYTQGRLRDRMSQIETGSPHELRLVGAIEADVERDLHKVMNGLRVRGEWFRREGLLEQLIAMIESGVDRKTIVSTIRKWASELCPKVKEQKLAASSDASRPRTVFIAEDLHRALSARKDKSGVRIQRQIDAILRPVLLPDKKRKRK